MPNGMYLEIETISGTVPHSKVIDAAARIKPTNQRFYRDADLR